MRDTTESEAAVYRIGAVARLTGLSANTIRTWERRHGAVEPMRTKGGGRLYSDADVERLLLLKQLTDKGDAISTLAELGTSALTGRLQRQESRTPPVPSGGHLGVALLHRSLGSALAGDPSGPFVWDVRVDSATVAGFIAGVTASPDLDAVILDLSLLGPEPEAAFEDCMEATSADVALVTYHFAARKQLDKLVAAGARVVRAPVEVDELKRLVRDQVFAPRRASDASPLSNERVLQPAAPRYSERQLQQLRIAQPSVECECPHHLAQLVETLVSFERYSASCAARSVKDRELHRALEVGTARARSIIEELLDLVVTHEGIVV